MYFPLVLVIAPEEMLFRFHIIFIFESFPLVIRLPVDNCHVTGVGMNKDHITWLGGLHCTR